MRLRHAKQIRYYPVGLISLLLIPLSYFLAVYKSTTFNERLLSCWFPPHVSCNMPQDDWIADKAYTIVDLTDNETKNKKAILRGRLLVRALVKSKDTSKGIRFKLCDEMKFETLIDLISTFEQEEAKIYVMNEENIWVMNPPIRKNNIIEFLTI